jgi:hypothetical protein
MKRSSIMRQREQRQQQLQQQQRLENQVTEDYEPYARSPSSLPATSQDVFESQDLLPLVSSFGDETVLGTLPLVHRSARSIFARRLPQEHKCAWALGPDGCYRDSLGEYEPACSLYCEQKFVRDLLNLGDVEWNESQQEPLRLKELRFGSKEFDVQKSRNSAGKLEEQELQELIDVAKKAPAGIADRFEVVWQSNRYRNPEEFKEPIRRLKQTWPAARSLRCSPTYWNGQERAKSLICQGRMPAWLVSDAARKNRLRVRAAQGI